VGHIGRGNRGRDEERGASNSNSSTKKREVFQQKILSWGFGLCFHSPLGPRKTALLSPFPFHL
jgi:hypothetical protein